MRHRLPDAAEWVASVRSANCARCHVGHRVVTARTLLHLAGATTLLASQRDIADFGARWNIVQQHFAIGIPKVFSQLLHSFALAHNLGMINQLAKSELLAAPIHHVQLNAHVRRSRALRYSNNTPWSY